MALSDRAKAYLANALADQSVAADIIALLNSLANTSFSSPGATLPLGSASIAVGSAAGGEVLSAKGFNSYAFGEDCRADADWSLAVGQSCHTSVFSSLANLSNQIVAGLSCTTTGSQCIALGVSSSAGNAANSFAFGTVCTASGGDCIALGDTCTSSGTDSFTLGHTCSATQTNTLAVGIGVQATASGAIAFGTLSGAFVNNAVNASGTNAVVIGICSDTSSKTLTASATKAIAIGMDINNSTASTMQLGMADAAKLSLSTTGTGFNGTAAIAKPTVTGSKGANAALTSLLTALANYGLVTDSTS